MQPFVSKRSLFAASLLALLGLAADPNDAGSDASPVADAAPDAAAGDAAVDASAALDATVPVSDGAGEAASDDGATPPAEAGPSEGVGFVQDDGGLPTYTGPNIFDFLCVERPDNTPLAYVDVKAPYTTPAACKTFAPEVGHSTARSCLCDSCFALQQQCDALAGCRTIQKCGPVRDADQQRRHWQRLHGAVAGDRDLRSQPHVSGAVTPGSNRDDRSTDGEIPLAQTW
jgi:hypothetical protein